jgi:glutathione peroxidase
VVALAAAPCPDLLNHAVKRLPSTEIENLCQYQGKVILVVNTASRCGFTPQFEGLQKIYDEYKSKGLVVLGFPSNDFNQEPDQGEQIVNYCKLNYGVDFPMHEKSVVKGAQANPFYKALSTAADSQPQWNFHKYLIARDAKMIIPFDSRVEPDSDALRAKIEALLDKSN